MNEVNKNNVGRGAAYLYLEAISLIFSGYIYWVILSKIASPSEIGISSTTISISLIFMTIASLGISNGIQSHIGRAWVDGKTEDIRRIIYASLLLVTLGSVISGFLIFIFADSIFSTHSEFSITSLSVLMMFFSVLAGLLRGIIIPSLNTRVITISSILSTVIKITVTVFLVFLDWGTIGILIGYMSYPIVTIVILTFISNNILYNGHRGSSYKIYLNFGRLSQISEILKPSFAFWVPNIVNIVGSQLGTIMVFVSTGAEEAGIFFMAFSIVTGISIILSVFSSIAYPSLSTLTTGRKRAVWRLTKISLLITLPISNILLFYTGEIMKFFGSSYLEGSSILIILLLSILPTALIIGISVLAYSYNNNKYVLISGLFTSIPRTIVYLALVPIFGGIGASVSYLAGAIIGAIVSMAVAHRLAMKIRWKTVSLLFIIPVLIAMPFKVLDINYIFSILCSLILSYLVFLKFKVISLEDLQDIAIVLPKSIGCPMVKFISNVFFKKKS